jgi:hypothetical protein
MHRLSAFLPMAFAIVALAVLFFVPAGVGWG